MRWTWLSLVLATGCDPGDVPPGPAHPCAAAVARLDIAPPDGDFGDLVDGGTLWCGNPPQGGAPYTPFRLRVVGPEALEDGVLVEMSAVDVVDGTELAYTELTMGLTCANVGESAGMWVGSEAHMRYFGQVLDDLDGREAEVTVRATSLGPRAVAVEAGWQVELVLD